MYVTLSITFTKKFRKESNSKRLLIQEAVIILYYSCTIEEIFRSLTVCSQPHPTLATIWTVVHQASLSVGFFRQEYCSGLLFPSAGDLSKPGITSPACLLHYWWVLYLLSHQGTFSQYSKIQKRKGQGKWVIAREMREF